MPGTSVPVVLTWLLETLVPRETIETILESRGNSGRTETSENQGKPGIIETVERLGLVELQETVETPEIFSRLGQV